MIQVNHLTKIERKTDGSAVDLRVLDAYDANGSRVISSVDVDGDGMGNATVTKYMLDGWNPAILPSPSGRGNGAENLALVRRLLKQHPSKQSIACKRIETNSSYCGRGDKVD